MNRLEYRTRRKVLKLKHMKIGNLAGVERKRLVDFEMGYIALENDEVERIKSFFKTFTEDLKHVSR